MTYRSRPLLRPLLALLTVLASVVFQVRVDALGGLRPAPQAATPAPHHPHHPGPHAVPARPASAPPQERSHPESSHTGHQAHCPFCFTGAFALEPGLAGLPQGPPDFLAPPLLTAPAPTFAQWRHVDARAPPFETVT